MPKKATQPELAPAPMPLVEYAVNGERWRCGQFDLLRAEVMPEGNASDLTLFHDAVQANERGWLIVRRLFGIQPVLPSMQYPIEDLRTWPREELREALGLTRAQVQTELDAVRGIWLGVRPKPKVEKIRDAVERVPTENPKEKAAEKGELYFGEEPLLKEHGFDQVHFATSEARAWFIGRVRDYDKLLRESATTGIAWHTIMTEYHLRLLDQVLSNPREGSIGGTEWRTKMKSRQELDATYQKQLATINTLAPWASALIGKYTMAGVLSDITRAIQEYHGRNDSRLVDGIFTALEVKVECRRSVQTPAPRYRAGLVVYLNAAKAGLWDPNWECPFTGPELKKLDVAWRAAAIAAGQENGERVPDLEKEGPEGEYEPLKAELKVEG